MRIVHTLVPVVLFLMAYGCHSPESVGPVDMPDIADSGQGPDLPDPERPDGAGGSEDFGGSDAGGDHEDAGDSGGWAPLILSEPGLWTQRAPCEGTVPAEKATDDSFTIPDNPNGSFDRTRADFVRINGPISSDVLTLVAAHEHEAGIYPYDLWANVGDDVVLRFFNIGPTSETRPGVSAIYTLLVNYQPVEARYEYLSEDLTEVVASVKATGSARAVDTNYQVVQITIPASALAPGTSNEIGFATIEHSTSFTLAYSRRLVVHYGGYDLPAPAPCSPQPLNEYRSYDEYRLRYLMRYSQTAIFLNPQPYIIGTHDEIDAQPGQRFTVNYSKFHYKKPTQYRDPIRVAMIPTMDGVPIGDTIWSMESGAIEENVTGFDIIDDRGTFDITVPEEPGVYDVSLMTWAYPFVRWRDIDGTPRLGFGGVLESRIPANSNVLRFRVK